MYVKALARKEADMFTKFKKDQDSQRVGTKEVGRMVEMGEKSAGARSCRAL